MKRAWAVMFVAAMFASCRTSQPTTNPFLRTTVPPPATTPGVVVTPGTPYAQGISPPMVTSPAPPVVTTPPPVTTQPVPVAPAPAVAPVPTMQQGDKFNPPGGNFLYHQSRYETPGAKSGRIVVQACYAPPEDRPQTVMSPEGIIENPYVVKSRKGQNPPPVSRDGYIENPYVKSKSKLPASPPVVQSPRMTKRPLVAKPAPQAQPLVAPKQQPAVAKSGRPVERLTLDPQPRMPAKVSVPSPGQGTTLRILDESVTSPASSAVVAVEPGNSTSRQTMRASETPTSDGVVLRITAGTGGSTVRSSAESNSPSVAAQAPAGGETTATFLVPSNADEPVVQATFQPAPNESQNYAHAPDYRKLRGRLEYSHSQRQWKLRYIPIDGPTDSYGGSVVLPAMAELEGLQPGDFIEVQGSLARQNGRATGYAPHFVPTSIIRLTR